MEYYTPRSNAELFKTVDSWARAVEVLSIGPFGLPVYCAIGGGQSEPAVLITAGSHADETSGMQAAATLMEYLDTDHKVYVVPNRDPLGWEGFAAGLSLAARVAAPTDHTSALTILRSVGEVLYEDGQFLVAMLDELAFAIVRPTPDTFGSEKIIKMLSYAMATHPPLASRLANRRVLVPANSPHCDGRGVLDRAYTVYVAEDGFIGSFNRFFGDPAAPIEVAALASLIDDVKPGLTIDLHEGWNDAYYMFVPEPSISAPLASKMQANVIAGLRQRGFPTSSLTELVPNMPDEHLNRFTPLGDGLMTWRWPNSPQDSPHGLALMPYALQYGVAFQTEVGRWSSLRHRIEYQRLVIKSLIERLTI